MSHMVEINYHQYSVECQSVCEQAECVLEELDKALKEIEEGASTLLDEQTEALRNAINRDRTDLYNQIERVRSLAKSDEDKGTVRKMVHRQSDMPKTATSVNDAEALKDLANSISVDRLTEYRSLISELLIDAIKDDARKRNEMAHGIVSVDDRTQLLLSSIEDDVLRQFTYISYLRDNALSGDALLNAGRELMETSVNQTYEQRMEAEKEKIRKELEARKLDKKKVDEIMSTKESGARNTLAAIRSAATDEIVGESVRQKSIKYIMQAIQARGFFVDRKNLKINRETNEVCLVALKASGEKAEFKVYVDGRFIYDFRGYEGQACQKDIEPFMRDLEEVYGIKVTDSKEIWKNPDKLNSMKYQTYKTNKTGE